jgi:hypothetical protein
LYNATLHYVVLRESKGVAPVRHGSSHFVHLLRLSTFSYLIQLYLCSTDSKRYAFLFVYYHWSVQASNFNTRDMYIIVFKLYDIMYIDHDRR